MRRGNIRVPSSWLLDHVFILSKISSRLNLVALIWSITTFVLNDPCVKRFNANLGSPSLQTTQISPSWTSSQTYPSTTTRFSRPGQHRLSVLDNTNLSVHDRTRFSVQDNTGFSALDNTEFFVLDNYTNFYVSNYTDFIRPGQTDFFVRDNQVIRPKLQHASLQVLDWPVKFRSRPKILQRSMLTLEDTQFVQLLGAKENNNNVASVLIYRTGVKGLQIKI